MIEEACICDDLPAHSHVYSPQVTEIPGGKKIEMVLDPHDVRIWVDWKEVARCFSQSSSQ